LFVSKSVFDPVSAEADNENIFLISISEGLNIHRLWIRSQSVEGQPAAAKKRNFFRFIKILVWFF